MTLANAGLAEYTNANFVSDSTIFASDAPHKFPYPKNDPSAGVTIKEVAISDPLHPGVTENRPYYFLKNDDGTQGYLLAGVSFMRFRAAMISPLNPGETIPTFREISPMDDLVHQGYADRLIPRAISYSAALLNYFFRGTLEISAPDICIYGLIDGSGSQNFPKLKAKVENTSSPIKDSAGNILSVEAIQSGTLRAVAKYKVRSNYAPDMSNDPPTASSIAHDFTYNISDEIRLTPDQVSAINNGATEFTFVFPNPIPAGITDLYLQVVFKGTLGNEADNAIAVGFKDLSEPTHINSWNTTDYTYLDGHLRESFEYEAITVQEKISFCSPVWPPENYQVTYDSATPGQFGELYLYPILARK